VDVENGLMAASERTMQQFADLRQSVATLQNLTIQQTQNVVSALPNNTEPAKGIVPSETTMLSPRALEISRQLRLAIANDRQRATHVQEETATGRNAGRGALPRPNSILGNSALLKQTESIFSQFSAAIAKNGTEKGSS
jgi:hypothetical protein